MGELVLLEGRKTDEELVFVPAPLFHFHHWSEWLDIANGDYRDSAHCYVKQERRCLTCNMAQLRLETTV
jgi:hypothetical protein